MIAGYDIYYQLLMVVIDVTVTNTLGKISCGLESYVDIQLGIVG